MRKRGRGGEVGGTRKLKNPRKEGKCFRIQIKSILCVREEVFFSTIACISIFHTFIPFPCKCLSSLQNNYCPQSLLCFSFPHPATKIPLSSTHKTLNCIGISYFSFDFSRLDHFIFLGDTYLNKLKYLHKLMWVGMEIL